MDDINNIVQERSPLEPIRVLVPWDSFYDNKPWYKRVKSWLQKNHPKVFIIEKQKDAWNIPQYFEIYFTTDELYLDFVNNFPEILRGGEDNG